MALEESEAKRAAREPVAEKPRAGELTSTGGVDAGTLATGAEASADGPGERTAGTTALGLSRWVQFGFVVAAVALFWFLDKLVTSIWDLFAEPRESVVTVVSAALALVLTLVAYRSSRTSRSAYQTAAELSKVTWPTRAETWAATGVVIVTSVVAAGILGAFDAVIKLLTDMLYS